QPRESGVGEQVQLVDTRRQVRRQDVRASARSLPRQARVGDLGAVADKNPAGRLETVLILRALNIEPDPVQRARRIDAAPGGVNWVARRDSRWAFAQQGGRA